MNDDSKDAPKLKIPSTGLTPELLALQMYDEALPQYGGDPRAASVAVIRFLTEALIFSVGVSAGGDGTVIEGMLKQLGKMIAEAPVHPFVAVFQDMKKETP